VHCISLPQPSVHVPLAPGQYNTFLTSAIDNSIQLWDLRSPHTVMALSAAHVNKRECVTCDLSPCLRYVATGSEDRAAVIYDVRTGRMLSRITGHKDVVSCVAFNPLFPQLAAGCYDGSVKFYADPTTFSST
jgi:WD40 repeat protein